MAVASKRAELGTVQAARGLAAVAVVLSHAGFLLFNAHYLGYAPFGGIFRFGHAGVDFFFVLSGFIITTIHRGDIGRPAAFESFVWKRLGRIFPTYWVVLFLAISAGKVIAHVKHWWPFMPLRSLVPSALLLPQHVPPIVPVAWTLEHELLFYALFAVLILSRRAGIVLFALWIALIVFSVTMQPRDTWPWAPMSLLYGFAGSSYHLEFLVGIAIAFVVPRISGRVGLLILVAGIAAFVESAALENNGHVAYLGYASQVLFGGSSALLLCGLVASERGGLIRAPRFLVFMGAASYSIYLCHIMVLFNVAPFLPWSTLVPILPGWSLMLMICSIGIAVGICVHLLAERPLQRLVRRLVAWRTATQALPAT